MTAEPTVMSEAAERVAEKRAARKAKADSPPDVQFGFQEIPLDLIDHGNNPRVDMGSTDMKGLTASIASDGVMQPIRVRPEGERFVIIAGHRRFEATKAAKLTTIPAMVVAVADPDIFIQSLVENIQREDLNALEEAQAYREIIEQTGMTQTAVAKRVGKSQPHVSNMIRILSLPAEIQHQVATGALTAAHAKNLVSLPAEKQKAVATKIVDEKMSTAQVERELQAARQQEEADAARAAQIEAHADEAETLLRDAKIKKSQFISADVSQAVVDALIERGWKKVKLHNWQETTPDPKWQCDCTGTYLSVWQRTVSRACVVRDHKLVAQAAIDAEKEALADEKRKIYEKGVRKFARSIRLDSGTLNIDGQRLALLTLLLKTRGGEALDALQARHGAPETGYTEYSAAWETIVGLNEKDLGEELVRALVPTNLPNPFSTPEYDLRAGVAVRQWLVDQFSIDERLLWGDHTPPSVEEVQGEEQELAAQALQMGDGNPVTYLSKFVPPHAFVPMGDDAIDEETGEEVPESEWICADDGISKGDHEKAYSAESMALFAEAVQPDRDGSPVPDAAEVPAEPESREPGLVDPVDAPTDPQFTPPGDTPVEEDTSAA